MGSSIITHIPVGTLSDIITKYLKFKRSLGYKYDTEEGTLYRFSLFTLNYEINDKYIPPQLITDWLVLRKGEKTANQHQRVHCVLQMLKFAVKYGYQVDVFETPHIKVNRYEPYIFTKKEISDFFQACDRLEPYPGSWRHIVVPVLFRLIYSCGLRASEAANLKCKDVDLDQGVITIHDAKFAKDRLVPVSDSMLTILSEFYYRFRNEPTDDMYFFPAKYSKSLGRHMIYTWFRLVLDNANITHLGKGKGPREHDIRHSFCVHTLKSMQDGGVDLFVALPILSTYLGHASIEATQYYLRLTAEFYPELINQTNTQCGSIIPSLEGEYENN